MRWTISKKLLMGFMSVVLMLAVAGIFGIRQVKLVGHEGDVILDEKVPIANASMEMIIALISARDLMGEYMLTVDPEALPEIEKEFRETLADFDKFGDKVKSDAKNEKILKLVKEADVFHEKFEVIAEEIMADQRAILASTSTELTEAEEEIRENMAVLDAASVKAEELLEEMELEAGRDMDAAMKTADAAVATSVWVLSTITIVGVLSGIGIGLFISRMISNPMILGVMAAQEIANGDLTQRLDVNSKDEIGDLANALNDMVGNLRQTMMQISEASEQVASGSEEISSSAENLSQAATEQAASLEETSAAVEELASSIDQNAEGAKEASKLSGEAVNVATQGGQDVENMMNSMQEIDASAKKIAEIISVIDDIADQTNLLALNAAIEAARAGEQGKGFAVVAVEVRKLAERSQQAAQEIATLIKESVKKTEDGSAMANKSGETLHEIIGSVQKVADLVQGINASSQEQANGANQITKAIEQLNQVTQQNSATSEESAAASEQLSSQAQMLQELVSTFNLGTTDKQRGNGSAGKKAKHLTETGLALKKGASTEHMKRTETADESEETFQEF